jgi:hypothetical protein
VSVKALFLLLLLLNVIFFAWVRLVGSAAPAPPESNSVRRLELVNERTTAAGPAGPARPRCLSVGPYVEQAAAERAVSLVRAPQRDVNLRHTEAEGSVSYRVVVATATLQLANSTAIRLRAAGVGDLEVIPPQAGATEAAVALGVYADRERAQRRIDELRRYEVTPVLLEVPRSISSWWLDVTERAANPAFDAVSLMKLIAAPAGIAVTPCAAPGTSKALATEGHTTPARTPRLPAAGLPGAKPA